MAKTAKAEAAENTQVSKVDSNFIFGTGRRKTAVARVFLYQEKGEFTINDTPISDYYTTEKDRLKWMKPFHAIGVSHPTAQFKASIKVRGSGKSAQLGAIVHGLSRALAMLNTEFAQTLRKQGLITRDSRMVERKKYFLRKARKAPQYSKR
jgi:small subunit ribosomal protein S9